MIDPLTVSNACSQEPGVTESFAARGTGNALTPKEKLPKGRRYPHYKGSLGFTQLMYSLNQCNGVVNGSLMVNPTAETEDMTFRP